MEDSTSDPYIGRAFTKHDLRENPESCSQLDFLPTLPSIGNSNNCNGNEFQFEENSIKANYGMLENNDLTYSKAFEPNYNPQTPVLFRSPKTTLSPQNSNFEGSSIEGGYYSKKFLNSNANDQLEKGDFFVAVQKNKFRSPSLEVAVSPEHFMVTSQYQENFSLDSTPIETNQQEHHNMSLMNVKPQNGKSPYSNEFVWYNNTTIPNSNGRLLQNKEMIQHNNIITTSNENVPNSEISIRNDKLNNEKVTSYNVNSPYRNNITTNKEINGSNSEMSPFSIGSLPQYNEINLGFGNSTFTNGKTRHSSETTFNNGKRITHSKNKTRSISVVSPPTKDNTLNDIFMSDTRMFDANVKTEENMLATTISLKTNKNEGNMCSENKVFKVMF